MNRTELSRDQLDPTIASHMSIWMEIISQILGLQGRNVRVFGFERDRRSCATERQGENKVGLGLEPRLRGFLPGNPGFRVRWRRFGKERGG
jgi:hypothetical protein